MQLPRAEGALLGVLAVDRMEMDRLQPDAGRIPVGGRFFHDDHLVRFPGFQHKGTVADELAGPGPGIAPLVGGAVFLDGRQRHGQPGHLRQQGEEIRRGMRQGDAQRAIVGGREAHLREVGQLALVEGFGVEHQVKQGRIVGRQRRRQDAAVGGHEVRRGDRVAIGPFRIGAQVEGVGKAVGRRLPALGHARHRMQVARILGHQAFEERGDDALLGKARHELRVEVADFGADAAVEDLFAVAALDVSLMAGTSGNQKPEAGSQKPEDERTAHDIACQHAPTAFGSGPPRGRRWRVRGQGHRPPHWSWPSGRRPPPADRRNWRARVSFHQGAEKFWASRR